MTTARIITFLKNWENKTMINLKQARMMNQQNKMAWLQRQVEARLITSHSQLLDASTKINLGSKGFAIVQDYFGTALPAR